MGKCISKERSITLKQSTTDARDDSIEEIDKRIETKLIISNSDKEFIYNSLKTHFLFASLSEQNMDSVYQNLKYFSLPEHEIIIKQGSPGKRFYIIESGQVEVIRDNIRKVVLTRGQTFGEMSLITNAPRRASLITLKETRLWGLSRKGFNSALRVVYEQNYSINRNFISNLPVFVGLPSSTKDSLTRACIQHTYPDNFRIICENDTGSMLFILKKGNAVAKIEGVEKFRINPGDMFGESVVFNQNTLITTSIFSVGKVECLSIDKESMIEILGNTFSTLVNKTISKHSLDSDKIIGLLPCENIEQIVENMKWVPVEPGDTICEPGCSNSLIYSICFGNFQSGSKTFNSNECFGLGNSNHKIVKSHGLIACSNGLIGSASKELIESITKIACKKLKRQLKIMKFLTKIEFFSDLSLKQLRYLSGKVNLIFFDTREIIFKKFDKARSFFVIRKGKIDVFDNHKKIRVLGKLDIFGESALKEKFRKKTAISKIASLCIEIPCDKYLSLSEFVELQKLSTRKSLMSLFELKEVKKLSKVKSNYYKIGLNASLGDNFPIFYVVVINKNSVDSLDICQQIVQSKNVAVYSEHPLLTKYIKSFIDSKFVYIFYEYIDIFPFNLIPKSYFNEDYVKFVSACILWIIEYLHNKNIVYRDLCPDNLGLKDNGYLILTTYTPAAVVSSNSFYKTCNPLYAAPEMFESKGYNKSVDLWALGVFIYRFLYSVFPFGIKESDTESQIYAKTVGNRLEFPNDTNFFKAEELLQVLLKREPKERTTIKNIKYMKWFTSVDFTRITSQNYEPPFIPRISNNNKNKKVISLQRYVHVIVN